jgi:hypothetical protein
MRTGISRFSKIALFVAMAGAAATAIGGDAPDSPNLTKYQGTWEIKAVMRSSADAEPIEISGIAEKKVVGDRWVISKFEADFFGVEFAGQDFFGYDKDAGHWRAVWVDSMNDANIQYTGNAPSDDGLVMSGRAKKGSTWVEEKRTDVWHGADQFDTNFVTVMPDGTEFQSLSIQHKRVAPPST